MFSNQSVRVHELSRPCAPTAHGVFPLLSYCSVMSSSASHVGGIAKPSAVKEVGLYQIVLFEFALATTP